ncbi:hypothetical protein BDW74DRAFT_167793 [Aspergillus multicolor]|uniref:uncharacterized protein n=1 Tax=Aspergillus multicolor TaxID=41759 RepID=UPI003CCDB1FA
MSLMNWAKKRRRGGFHTKNNPKQPYKRETVHEDRRRVHGKWSLRVRRTMRRLPGRASRPPLLPSHSLANQMKTTIQEWLTSLNGTYSLIEKEQTEVTAEGYEGTKKYEKTVTRQVSDATYVSGSSCLLGAEWDPDDAVIWRLKENATLKTGVPVYVRAGVLLKRITEAPFQCTVEIDMKVDARSTIKRLFGGKSKDDPVLFDPNMQATNRLMEYDLQQLGSFDMSLVEDITFITVFDGAVKHAKA